METGSDRAQTSRAFEITSSRPTPIVGDFDLFLEAVESPSAYLTPRGRLNRKTLHTLDQKMRTFRTDTHPRTDQEHYVLLNLFQRLCVAGRLHTPGKTRGKLRMTPTERLEAFRRLPPPGRFLAMLETLWVDCNWDELSSWHSHGGLSGFVAEMLLERLTQLRPGRSTDLANDGIDNCNGAYFLCGMHPLPAVLGFFGFLDFTLAPQRESRFMRKGSLAISTLAITEMGSHFLKVLKESRPHHLWNLPWRKDCQPRFPGQSIEPGDAGVEAETPFAEAFAHLLAVDAEQLVLPRPVRRLRKGTYVFHVTLGRVSRTISTSHTHTLQDLHLTIQDAFGFDNDHLYAFHMDGKAYSPDAYHDSRADGPPFADEAVVGELDLYVGQRILYLFDFGDNWEFGVELREFSDAPHRGRPRIVAEKGTAPEQYRHW